jgi:2-keto-4-pentenoate hydratase/2-oxohepta-3-ene-1,7-dioic acid hydratase in catechol pathway
METTEPVAASGRQVGKEPLIGGTDNIATRIARIDHEGAPRLAAVEGKTVALLGSSSRGAETEAMSLPRAELRELAADALSNGERLDLDEVDLLPAVARPGKIIAIGLNYADHIAESGQPTPEVPTVFAKFSSAVTGPRSPIQRPLVSDSLDYEGELAFVIGERCRHVAREDARQVIGGYLILNDISVRAWQVQTPQWTLAKSFDTHAPIGPWITISDLDPHALSIETYVNGELRQRSDTSKLVFDCYDLVAYLSQACTLYPGDVIATGTPAGVGGAMDPPRYLASGDQVTVEIEGLGKLENLVVDEPQPTGSPAGADTATAL